MILCRRFSNEGKRLIHQTGGFACARMDLSASLASANYVFELPYSVPGMAIRRCTARRSTATPSRSNFSLSGRPRWTPKTTAGNRIDSFAPAVGRCAEQAPHRRVLQDDTTALRRAERPHRRGRAPPAAQGVAGRAARRRVFPVPWYRRGVTASPERRQVDRAAQGCVQRTLWRDRYAARRRRQRVREQRPRVLKRLCSGYQSTPLCWL